MCLNFASTGSRILLPPLSLSRRVIQSWKNRIKFQWGSKLQGTSSEPCIGLVGMKNRFDTGHGSRVVVIFVAVSDSLLSLWYRTCLAGTISPECLFSLKISNFCSNYLLCLNVHAAAFLASFSFCQTELLCSPTYYHLLRILREAYLYNLKLDIILVKKKKKKKKKNVGPN